METIGISLFSLLMAFCMLVVPLILSRIYGLRLARPLFVSVARMSVQLFLIGIFLKYLFFWNNPLINILWLMVMVLVAVLSAVHNSSMRLAKIFVPVFLSFLTATLTVVFYLNYFVIRLEYVFDARYLIVLGGMLLGNSLRGNIVGIDFFYKSIKSEQKKYLYVLSLGASHREAVLPYLRESVLLALKPTIASMATMGVVALPGMMTGVILGGADPALAVKYQVVIMIAIVVSTIASVILTILNTLGVCFTRAGVLRSDVFLSNNLIK